MATGVAVALLLGLTACSGGGDPASGQDGPDDRPSPQGSLVLDFESGPRPGQRVEAVTNEGTEPIDVVVADSESARVESVEGPDSGHAVRFPAYTGESAAPAAVLVAAADETGPQPGAARKLRRPWPVKIQLDHGVPSCRLAVDAGEVFVEADEAVDLGVWYSVSCEREGSEVSLTVTPYDDQDDRESWRASGPTGTISFEDQPLSVGGKVDPAGIPVASADQFNGAVDDVFLRIE